jgi:hypothetical protein
VLHAGRGAVIIAVNGFIYACMFAASDPAWREYGSG